MKEFIGVIFFITFSLNLKTEISLRVNWPPPLSCGNGCDHTAGYPTGSCYQCPNGS